MLNFIQENAHKQSEKNVFTGRVASPWALLAHDRFSRSTGHHTHLLPELGLSLLHGGHEHVADTSGGQTVKATADSVDGDHVQVLGSGVVGTVHHGAHGQTEGDAELASRGTSTSWMRPKNRGLLVLHTTTLTLSTSGASHFARLAARFVRIFTSLRHFAARGLVIPRLFAS